MRIMLFIILVLSGSWCFASNKLPEMCLTFCSSDKDKCQKEANNGYFFAYPNQQSWEKENRGIKENKSATPPNQGWQSTKNSIVSELQAKCDAAYNQCVNSCKDD